MALRFGTDGVRGLANTELTPDVAMALGRAAVEVLGADGFVIGRDTRRSGPMLEAALVAGICSAGSDVELLGVVPSPAVAWASASLNRPGAVISASHNPFADNGIKLFAPGGLKLDDDIETRIEAAYFALLGGGYGDGGSGDAGSSESSDPRSTVTGADVGTLAASGGIDGWIDEVCASIGGRTLDGLTIVLDCANGSASGHGPRIFKALGATIHVIGDDPNGININDGYGSTDPTRLSEAVVGWNADLGLAFDGDADRLIAVDNEGAVVDGDRVLALLAVDWAGRGQLRHNTVVVTVMSNLGFHRAMAEAGIGVVTTAVGDRYVLQALDDRHLSLGGEQSGHVICRDLATTGDGALSGVQLADTILRAGVPLSRMAADAMTTVPQILHNIRLPQRDDGLVARMAEEISRVEALFGADGRVLVRASGTEPLLRVMVEHIDRRIADESCRQLVSAAQRLVGPS
ncbi:MAG: phosphoglucosamine mutase [Actinomycetia bacterium]|nr:phosphoglucosamine mutase [Actinomycetes bacterium]